MTDRSDDGVTHIAAETIRGGIGMAQFLIWAVILGFVGMWLGPTVSGIMLVGIFVIYPWYTFIRDQRVGSMAVIIAASIALPVGLYLWRDIPLTFVSFFSILGLGPIFFIVFDAWYLDFDDDEELVDTAARLAGGRAVLNKLTGK